MQNRRFHTRSAIALLALAIAGSAPVTVSAATLIVAAPPAPIVEVRPAAPAPGWVWMDGYWNWAGGRHVWVRGRWVAPHPGYHWVGHHWVHERGGWRLEDGHWER
jgi:WXXGXW repeat (2 copies)